jgi:hypothetical protein
VSEHTCVLQYWCQICLLFLVETLIPEFWHIETTLIQIK